jgi:hypothetical protein
MIRLSFAIIWYLGDGTLGQFASHTGENLIMALQHRSISLAALALPGQHRVVCATFRPSRARAGGGGGGGPVGWGRRGRRSGGVVFSPEAVVRSGCPLRSRRAKA